MLSENNFVPKEHIDALAAACEEKVFTVFGNCTVVAWKMPNGFTLVEHSGCIDKENYSEQVGADICRPRLRDRIWMLEGYVGANEFTQRASGEQ